MIVDKRFELSNLKFDATVYDPGSGRIVEILTDQPGIRVYIFKNKEKNGKNRSETK